MMPHTFSYNELTNAVTELGTKVLLPGKNSSTGEEHERLTAWIAELILASEEDKRQSKILELRSKFPSLASDEDIRSFQTEQSKISPQTSTEATLKATLAIPFAANLIRKSDEAKNTDHLGIGNAKVYCVFPLLESLGREVASEYLTPDGKVIQPFTVQKREYIANNNKRCNSVGDVLILIETKIADNSLGKDLTRFKESIEEITNSKCGYSKIFVWRNANLHGEKYHLTISQTILFLALRLGLHNIREEFEQLQEKQIQKISGPTKPLVYNRYLNSDSSFSG